MLECNRFVKKKLTLMKRAAALLLVIVCIVLLLTQTALAKNTYVINDGNHVFLHTTYATDPAEILDEAGLELGTEDTFTTQSTSGGPQITVQRKQTITVTYGGKQLQYSSYGEALGGLLQRVGLILTPEDIVSLPLNATTYDGMCVTISRSVKTEQTYTAPIPHKTVYCYDATVPKGEEVILTPGSPGQLLCTAEVTYVDGKEISRTVISEVVTRQPVDQLVAIGTYVEQAAPIPMPAEPSATVPPLTQLPSGEENKDTPAMPVAGNGVITTFDGQTLKFSKKLDVVATAYSCNGEPGITFSGTPARVGAIAVDPNYIPLGTKMYVVSNDGEYVYGVCTAEDTGGSIKGYKIDLYFETFDECWIFGVRDCTVYILEE